MEKERTFRVVFEITAAEKDLVIFFLPTAEWIEDMVAKPSSSIFKMAHCHVDEVTR